MKDNAGNYFDDLQYEDLTEDLKVVADYIGVEHTRVIMKIFRGTRLSIPSKPSNSFCTRYIKENYNGKNKYKILLHLGISNTKFYRISKKLKQLL